MRTGGIGGQAPLTAPHAPALIPSPPPPSASLPAHLHHGVVAEAPFGATQHRPSIDVDGPPALIGNEEVTVIF